MGLISRPSWLSVLSLGGLRCLVGRFGCIVGWVRGHGHGWVRGHINTSVNVLLYALLYALLYVLLDVLLDIL
jgi:hypothetical protein